MFFSFIQKFSVIKFNIHSLTDQIPCISEVNIEKSVIDVRDNVSHTKIANIVEANVSHAEEVVSNVEGDSIHEESQLPSTSVNSSQNCDDPQMQVHDLL